MRIVGAIVLGMTCLLLFWKFGDVSLWSVGLGTALGVGCFTIFAPNKPEAPTQPVQTNEWPNRFHLLEAQTAQTVDGLNKEVQKMQQKLMRSEERCTSYQKLVDVHQSEIDKLTQEKNTLTESLIEKDRKLSEAQLARLEPELFDTEKRQTEISFRELKKQFEEKSHILDQTRSKLFRADSELLALKKEKEDELRRVNPTELTLIDQLTKAEEEKKKLETELFSLQQLVSELSLLKPKKKKPISSESRDLLG